jgi:glycosyltransferase involved in cell wall biosynthesis
MLIRKIREFDPDLINVHFPDPQWPYLKLISKVAKAPILTSLHGHDILRFFDADGSPMDIEFHWEDLMRSSGGLTACSQWMIDQARRLGPMPVPAQPIWNGVDLVRFGHQTDRPIDDKYLFAFGRLEHHKGFHILLWAFQLLHRKDDLKLVIAGSGKEESALLKRAEELGVSDQVVFTGRLDQDQVVAYAQHAEVVVVPSLREPFGISLLEALASGRPVVATKVGGMVEIGRRFGLELVEPNGTAMAEGIKTALASSEAPTTRENTLRNEFSVDRMVEGYVEMFESLFRED